MNDDNFRGHLNDAKINDSLYQDVVNALQMANVLGIFKNRFGNVRISQRDALGQYHFSVKTLEAFEKFRDGAVKRTNGKRTSAKLFPLYALVEIELADKIVEDVIKCDIIIREHDRSRKSIKIDEDIQV